MFYGIVFGPDSNDMNQQSAFSPVLKIQENIFHNIYRTAIDRLESQITPDVV